MKSLKADFSSVSLRANYQGLTLEMSALKLFAVENLRQQLG